MSSPSGNPYPEVGGSAIRSGARDESRIVNFDIADYKRRAERLRWDDLDFESFADHPLDADTLRCIEYMHDVELHTICYLRDLLVTPAHGDPDVTAFLSCWAYEEMWHGEALAAVLEAHGRPAGGHESARCAGASVCVIGCGRCSRPSDHGRPASASSPCT